MMKQKKCLILYCDTGGGFRAPSVAVMKEMEARGYNVTLLDFARDTGSSFVDNSLKRGWKLWLKYPQLFDYYLSFLSDRATIIRMLNKTMLKTEQRLLELIRKEKYDVIFSTHFAATQAIGDIKKRCGIKTPVFAYNADVLVGHRCWLHEGIDGYFVPSQQAYDDMLERGIKKDRLFLVDFPIDSKFADPKSRKETLKELGLQDRFTITLTQGGEGIGKVEEYARALLQLKEKVNVIVICGKNASLYNKLKALEKTNDSLRAFGFVGNMQDFYGCADLAAGKAGFNFVFESIYMQLPIIVNNAIANERIAARFIVSNGMGWRAESTKEFPMLVEKIMSNRKMLEHARNNMKKFRFSLKGAGEMAEKLIESAEAGKENVLLFDIGGTLCMLDMGERNWMPANMKGIKEVLKRVGIEKYSDEDAAGLAERFVAEKSRLRKDSKATLREHPLKDQLESFFSSIKIKPSKEKEFAKLLHKDGKRDEKLFNELDLVFIQPELALARPLPDVRKTLEKLSKNYKIAAISNNASNILPHELLKKCGITKYFSDVLLSADIGYRKPHEKFAEHVTRKLNISPENCNVIGDRLNQDILLATKSGMKSIYVKMAKHDDNIGVKGIVPDHEIEKFSQLLDVL